MVLEGLDKFGVPDVVGLWKFYVFFDDLSDYKESFVRNKSRSRGKLGLFQFDGLKPSNSYDHRCKQLVSGG